MPPSCDDNYVENGIVVAAKTSKHCVSTLHRDLGFKKVVVHPLVLLSVVDHFNRVSKTQNVQRVVGVLLGSVKLDKTLDVANSFAVPFDEDSRDKNIFFFDQDYLENMYSMFHKVAAREKIVGWYHTGPKLCKNDIEINNLLKKFTLHPILVVIQIEHNEKEIGLPTNAYIEVQEVHDDGTPPIKTFEHLPSEIGAEEAEEVGVEHLLRDIKDQTAGTLSQRITNQLMGLRGLLRHLDDIKRYLQEVCNGDISMNHAIVYYVQELLNLLSNVTSPWLVDSHNIQSNDQMMCIYLGCLARSIIAFHNLIDNKLQLEELQNEQTEKKKIEKNSKAKNLNETDKSNNNASSKTASKITKTYSKSESDSEGMDFE